jgi:hypothetical protein
LLDFLKRNTYGLLNQNVFTSFSGLASQWRQRRIDRSDHHDANIRRGNGFGY